MILKTFRLISLQSSQCRTDACNERQNFKKMTQHEEATKAESRRLLCQLLDDPDQIMADLAPQGWQTSPLRRIFHPTAEQQLTKAVQISENLHSLLKKKNPAAERRTYRLEDFQEDPLDAGNPRDELIKLLGDCLWLIFSNNHTVIGADDRIFKLGSFRGSGRFIADFLNEHFPSVNGIQYDYIDFYCAGVAAFDLVDTTPVFELLFGRLRKLGCDWEYYFPRMEIVDFSGLHDTLNAQNSDPATYDPQEAMAKALEQQQKKEATEAFRRRLDEIYEQEFEDAKYKKPPAEVQAYRNVFGRLPDGFPV